MKTIRDLVVRAAPRCFFSLGLACALTLAAATLARGQAAGTMKENSASAPVGVPQPASTAGALTLAAAVRQALAQYPGILVARRAAAQAQAQVGLAQTNFLPIVGLTGQFDRATDNAVLGLSFPSPLPSISGTVPSTDYSQSSAWTSAAGVYFNWEVLDFGRRRANVTFYRSLALQSQDLLELTELQVAAHAADAFLSVVAAQQQQDVARADVARWSEIDSIVHTLVAQQLRPGADASRADAELARAHIGLAQADRAAAIAAAVLAEALAVAAAPPLAARALLAHRLPPLPAAPDPPASEAALLHQHPQARAQDAAIVAVQDSLRELARSALPRSYVLGSAYGRGTGVLAAGHLADGLTGLAPTDARNWAIGLGIDFSFTRFAQTRAQQTAARAQLGREQARYTQLLGQLWEQQQQAHADLDAALRTAAESPVELRAAETGEAQARVRYQTGLAGIVDLADAEALLARAQSDDALSQLQVWRGRLENAFAAGDLTPFLAAIAATGD